MKPPAEVGPPLYRAAALRVPYGVRCRLPAEVELPKM